jgi:hypothetical protein
MEIQNFEKPSFIEGDYYAVVLTRGGIVYEFYYINIEDANNDFTNRVVEEAKLCSLLQNKCLIGLYKSIDDKIKCIHQTKIEGFR